MLVGVYNQKHNPFNEEILFEWLDIEDVSIETLNVESVHVAKGIDDEDSFEDDEDME